MVNVTIDDLLGIGNGQLLLAKVALQQGGVTFKAPSRPNPANTFYVTSDDQLEEQLGPDRLIPTNTNIAIIFDASFSVTKPFKKQSNSGLLLYSQSAFVTVTYSGTGAMIQMDGAVVGKFTQIDNLVLAGNFTNNCFAIVDSDFTTVRQSSIQTFAKIGFITSLVVWKEVSYFANAGGIDFIDCPVVLYADNTGDALGFSPGLTLASFVSTSEMDIVFRNSEYNSTAIFDEFLFIDPNLSNTSSITITRSGIVTTIDNGLFQLGVDVAVTAVADNGSGAIRCTATAHGQVNGTYAVLSGFSEAYNGTALITVIDNDTFDVESVTFTLTDTGTINRKGLDSTDPRVLALDNPNQRDSMFIGEAGLEIFMSPISSSSLAQNAFEAITSASWVSTNLERFEDDTVTINQGRLVAKDISSREYDVSYSATIEKSSGGPNTNVGIIILVNGLEVAFNPPHTVNTGLIQISGSDLIELAEDDVIQVGVKNYDSANATIDISQVSLVISKG